MFYFLNNLYIRIFLAGFLAMFTYKSDAQSIIDGQNVEVTFNKTSSIVFAANITSVDRGSRDVLAQKAKGVNNVLQLKAGKSNFKETNLTVITEDGKLHHFFVQYADKPSDFTLLADAEWNNENPSLSFQSEMTESEMEGYASAIISSDHGKHSIKSDTEYDMRLSLKGIYIKDNIMFYHLNIRNQSNIPYHPELIRFFVKDRQKAKRTASQEVPELPIYRYGDVDVIKGQSSVDVIYALPKFTIPDAKLLNIELMEHRGGRHLLLRIKNKRIVKARAISN